MDKTLRIIMAERMMVFPDHLLIEDEEGRHFIAARELNAPLRQVAYLPMWEIERTH